MAAATYGLAPKSRYFWRRCCFAVMLWATLSCLYSCRKGEERQVSVILPPLTVLHDKTFHSEALGHDVTYRVIEPASLPSTAPVQVVYLLHGNGSGFREWSTSSSIAQLAESGYVLVMPEGHSSYFMNSASKSNERYEDFVTRDLIADAERDLRGPPDRLHRSIVGVSMGGFAAIVLALKHPDLYSFVGALSPPVDMPRRAFTFRRISQSLGIRAIFGPEGTRAANDPFALAGTANVGSAPFLFLSVGEQESLAEPVKRFDALLRTRRIPHEFHIAPGGHDWQQWNRQLPGLVRAIKSR
jgi:putative tributyrin esterase